MNNPSLAGKKRGRTNNHVLGASLGMALLLSTARSFSVNTVHSPRARISSRVSSANQQLPGTIGNTSLNARQRSNTALPYLNYDLDFFDSTTTRLADISLVPDTQSKPGSSVEDGWQGLSNLYSSPAEFSLGWSFFVPKGVSAHQFATTNEGSSPLVLTPDHRTSVSASSSGGEFLRTFLQTNQKWVDEQILEFGAVVFRGFAAAAAAAAAGETTTTASIGKEILRALDHRKDLEYYLVSDTNVFPASSSPSTTRRFVEIGPQARLTDWRGIHDSLPPKLLRKLNEKDLLYKRRDLVRPVSSTEILFREDDDDLTQLGTVAAFESSQPSSWYRLFGSTNKHVFEKAYRLTILDYPQTDVFEESSFVCEAFRSHPHNAKDKIWFEHAHRFHWTSLPAELLNDFWTTKNPRILAKAAKESWLAVWRRLVRGTMHRRKSLLSSSLSPETATTTVAFGDGKPISWWEMRQIRRAIQKNTASHSWRPGDLVVVDGLSMGLQL